MVFRPRLSAGLALSVVLRNIVHLNSYASVGNDRFGSLAAPLTNISLMSALEGKAVIGFDLTLLAQAKRRFLKCSAISEA